MRPLHWLAFLAVLFGTNVESIELRPRKGQDCALLSNNKIYCYGGYILGNSDEDFLYSLDIYKNDGKPPQHLNSQWEEVTPAPTKIKIGRRGYPQAAATPDGERFLIHGGYDYGTGPIVEQTIAYNVKTNSWESFANYNDANNGGDRQIYYGSGEYIPSLNQFGYFGGYQQHVIAGSNYITPDGISISGLTFNNSDYMISYAGFHYLTLFDINTNIWTVPPQSNVPKDYHLLFSATYHAKSKKVFYIGGSYYNTTSDSVYNAYLTYARTFNTANGEWLRESINGNTPTQREQHTTTLLPNGDDILLYGGNLFNDVAIMDYCYTLNVPTMVWRYHNLVAPAGFSGPRSHHSAVLVNNTSLFIMFGLNKDATRTNELLILDVRDVDNLKFAATFPFDGGIDTTGNNITGGDTSDEYTGSDDDHKEGLSTGAIAGIAVGGVIAGALLVLALVYYSRGKKIRQGVNGSGDSTHYEQQRNTDGELLEVDWDKIDDHYKEVSVPPASAAPAPQYQQQQQQHYTHQRYLSDDLYSDANSSTGISSNQLPDISTTSSPETRSPGIPPGYVESKPNAGPVSPDVAIAPVMMKVVKPDGGN